MSTTNSPHGPKYEMKCGYCGGVKNLQRCGRCHLVQYCSKEHQKLHWKAHKKFCASKGSDTEKPEDINASESVLAKSVVSNGLGVLDDASHFEVSADAKIENKDLTQVPQPVPRSANSVSDVDKNASSAVSNSVVNSKVKKGKKSKSSSKQNIKTDCNSAESSELNENTSVSSNSANLEEKDGDNSENCAPESNLVLNGLSSRMAATANGLRSTTVAPKPSAMPSSTLISANSSPEASPVAAKLLQPNIPFFHRHSTTSGLNPDLRRLVISKQVIADLDKFGVCVIDNLLGEQVGEEVLGEVIKLYNKSGAFQDGQLVREDGTRTQSIRGDKITWIDKGEPGCKYITSLIELVDTVIMQACRMENNGKLGSYTIRDRTRAMIACYPGSGTRYVKHVDNPNNDGRCVTAIYYLNKDWNTKVDGGLLRIFPDGWPDRVADIEPLFDRLLFFWSDRRNPHEVQPAYRMRYAITLWYFDANEKELAKSRKNGSFQQFNPN